MAKLPSFRPRGALGFDARQQIVTAAPEFLRWLDQLIQAIGLTSPTPAGTTRISFSSDEPEGWKILNGQALSKATYPTLYAIFGDAFGATATTFNLPNMANRALIGAGDIPLARYGGSSSFTLSEANLPAHTHAVTDPGHGHAVTDPGHTHTITDPGHNHDSRIIAGGTGGFTGTSTATLDKTSTDTTGITIDSATTGVSVDNGTTGISVANTGSGEAVQFTPLGLGAYLLVKT